MSVGMTTYARELAARLPRVAPQFEYVTFSRGRNFGWDEQVRLPLAIRRARVALMHFLSLYVPVIVPSRFVLTIHDLIHLHFPHHFKAKVGPYYRSVVHFACARAARVITDDERTVQDLVTLLGVARSKIRVVPLGVAESFFEPAPQQVTARPYFLYVGNHRKHKDLATLFEAWSRLPAECGVDLYVTGPDDFGGELERRSTAARAIVALGDVTPARLRAYYAGASALVQPSLREGFGLPVLEAMAAGAPVVASDAAVPRVLQAAALTFPAGDAGALSGRLREMLAAPGAREEWVKRGREAAARLTWDHCASATADVYREVLEEG